MSKKLIYPTGNRPDNCDGSYDASCDTSRQYYNITDILTAAGANDLLSYMDVYWKDYQGNDESFWQHEWNKHGTCVSTLDPSCYIDYAPQQEVVDFFQTAVNLFKGLDTYRALEAAGITPSYDRRYTAREIEDALSQVTGHMVTISCKRGELNEVWYYYNVQGSLQSGTFVATDPGTYRRFDATEVLF
jgi:ribonuclease T2